VQLLPLPERAHLATRYADQTLLVAKSLTLWQRRQCDAGHITWHEFREFDYYDPGRNLPAAALLLLTVRRTIRGG
jgi:hypothetical protein